MSGDLYGFEPARDRFPVDPTTVNFQEVQQVIVMAGWRVVSNREDDGTVNFRINSLGGAGNMSAEVLTEELGLRDDEGKMLDGYSVSGAGNSMQLTFRGSPDLKFADMASRLYVISPYTS